MKHVFELLSDLREKGISIFADASGENLKVKGKVSLLDEASKAGLRQHKERILALLKRGNTGGTTVPKAAPDSSFPLSSTQERFWLLSQSAEGSGAYHIYTAIAFQQQPDTGRLEYCLGLLVEKHEILRTVFRQSATGAVRQYVQSASGMPFVLYRGLLGEITTFIRASFDLVNGPVLRAGLFLASSGEHVFTLVLHHITGDGWSIDVLLKELMALYVAGDNASPEMLPELAFQYKDFAVWQQGWRDIPGMAAERRYWMDRFADPAPALSLPSDRPRPVLKTFAGASVQMPVPASVKDGLSALCRAQSASLFMGLLAAVNTWMYRYTGQTDLVIGTPVAGRDEEGLAGQVGPYVNMLALRNRMGERRDFLALLDEVKNIVLGAHENQHFPFDQLIEELGVTPERNRNPLFDVVVVFREGREAQQRAFIEQTAIGLGVIPQIDYATSKFDLTFYFTLDDNRLEMDLEYDTDLFDAPTVEQFGKHFIALLHAAVGNPSMPVELLTFLDAEERRQLLEDFNGFVMPFPKEGSIVTLLERQVMQNPASEAIVGEAMRMTYSELNGMANRLARYLREKYRPGSESIIGICLERTEWMWITILAVLKSGAAYMPIDIEYPRERIDYMIGDSECLGVVDKEELSRFQQDIYAYSDDNMGVYLPGERAVYLIYTSGSTGKPKGVMVGSRSLINLCYWHIDAFGVTAVDRAALYAGAGFDAAVWEFFPYLLAGSTLFIVPDAVRLAVGELAVFFDAQQISISFLPTQVAEQFNEIGNKSLRCLLTGGDKLSRFEKRSYRLINNYGPTENTVVTTSGEINETRPNIPIGKPIANTRVYIMDREGQLCPVGVAGELYIGGENLSFGYWRQPELNKERFVQLAAAGGERAYRSGDMGRWLSDGTIEFLGRADDQIKIRGYRIEPGEIEAALRQLPGITAAVVLARMNPVGAKEVVAYLCCAAPLEPLSLRAHLAALLPAHMIPGRLIQMDAFPLTPNGKLDKQALPDPWEKGNLPEAEFVAPVSDTEVRLVSIWAVLLGVQRISRTDDFFLLGGHSLKIARLASAIVKEFGVNPPIKELLIRPGLKEQALLIEGAAPAGGANIVRQVDRADYPLSSVQRRLWILSRTRAGNLAYSIVGVYAFGGALKPVVLERVVNELVDRYEILRTTFFARADGEVRQRIAKRGEGLVPVIVKDLYRNERLIDSWVDEVLAEPFDLEAGPLLRINIGFIGEDNWRIVVCMHHIISDGWSVDILVGEMTRLYQQYLMGKAAVGVELPIQYRDFVLWQEAQLAAGNWQYHREYWLQHLSGYQPLPELPADRARTPRSDFEGGSVEWAADRRLHGLLQGKELVSGATPFMIMLAALSALLYRYSGESDRVIGAPVAGRTSAELQDQLGCFVNSLPLRIRVDRQMSFRQLIMQCRDCLVGALEHQEYPFDLLLDALSWPMEAGRNPLFDVQLIYAEDAVWNVPELPMRQLQREAVTSQFDLSFIFRQTGDVPALTILYRRDLFDRETVVRMGDHFQQLLAVVLDEPDRSIASFEYLTSKEKEQLLFEFNDTAMSFPGDVTLAQLFYRRCELHPDEIALVFREQSFTFRQLRSESNRFARFLRHHYSIQPNDLVAVCLKKSDRLIIALLGILNAGGAYLPLDPGHPADRRNYIINDSRSKVCVDEGFWERFLAGSEGYEETDLEPGSGPRDLAYVIYTSGSTGTPKGCMLEHRGVVNRIAWMYDRYGFGHDDVILQKTSYAFDVSVWELFLPLRWGGRMVLCEEQDMVSPVRILSLIVSQGVTCLHFVPGMLSAFIAGLPDDASDKVLLRSLRRVITSGEALPLATVREWYGRVSVPIHNLYGPTEASIDVTAYTTTILDTRIPIGQPIWNTRIYILGSENELVPVGVAGEICLAGIGLARGYLMRPELTAGKFTDHPFIAGERIYRTGDLGQWLADGNIDYLGRIDQQVKVRGYRVEPGEIENLLLTHDYIGEAAVVVRKGEDGENELLGCVVFRRPMELRELRAFMGRSLPAYMIPGKFYCLQALPVTSSGKLDRKALPGVSAIALSSDPEHGAPSDSTEVVLVQLWKEILEKGTVSMEDHFLESGGHSLRAIRLINRIRQDLGVSIGLDELIACDSLKAQAELIRHSQRSGQDVIPLIDEADTYAVSDQQRRLWLVCQDCEANIAYNMADACLLEGELDQAALEKAFAMLIWRHEILRTVFVEIYPGQPAQKVLTPEEAGFSPGYFDLRECLDTEEMLESFLHADAIRPFALDRERLLRVAIYRLAANRWALSFCMHHIISDGWSMRILIQEVLELYTDYTQGRTEFLEGLALQYKDYAAWYNQRLSGEYAKQGRNYWLKKLAAPPVACTLAADLPRGDKKTFSGGALLFEIAKEDLIPLKQLGGRLGLTLYMQLLALLKSLLYLYTSQEDIITGVPVSGRDHLTLERSLGFYVNTLALRDRVGPMSTFTEVLVSVKQTVMEAFRYADFPFGQLIEGLSVSPVGEYNPLFEVMIVLQDAQSGRLPTAIGDGKLRLTPLSVGTTTSRFDLNFNMVETPVGLSVRLEYNNGLYEDASMLLLKERWLHLLRLLPISPDIPLMDIPIDSDPVEVAHWDLLA